MQKKYFYALFVYMLIPLSGMSTDIYLPSMPNMVSSFATNVSFVQLTITCFVVAMGIGQLLAGPISDAYGRKPLIVSALLIQLITLAVIIYSPSISVILCARFIQGLAVAFMSVPARAILNDVFEQDSLRKHFNYLTIVFALGPIVAPFIGGYTEHYFGWQGSFTFLLVYVAICFALAVFFYSETLPQRSSLNFPKVLNSYKTILSNWDYMIVAIFAGVLFGYTTVFSVTGAFIFQDFLGFSPLIYGYIALGGGMAWFLGNVTNRLLFEIKPVRKVPVLLGLSFVIACLMVLLAYFRVENFWTIALPSYLLIYFTGIVFPNLVADCLTKFREMAATSNACFFSLTWLFFSLYSAIATGLTLTTILPVAVTFLLVNLISLIVMVLVYKR